MYVSQPLYSPKWISYVGNEFGISRFDAVLHVHVVNWYLHWGVLTLMISHLHYFFVSSGDGMYFTSHE